MKEDTRAADGAEVSDNGQKLGAAGAHRSSARASPPAGRWGARQAGGSRLEWCYPATTQQKLLLLLLLMMNTICLALAIIK